MTRPAMVAEYWQAGQCKGQQHLLIGVPSQSAEAPRPSHFDRIDSIPMINEVLRSLVIEP